MVIELEIEFHENEIPPKCRLPRPVKHKDTIKVKIAETTPGGPDSIRNSRPG